MTKNDKLFESLNNEQIESVTTSEGYVRVIAGAGSGKTRALTNRFAYLVSKLGIQPDNILCVTFTNKAAGEMKKRVRKLTYDNDFGYICTFHGLCHKILKFDISKLNWPKSFQILDDDDQRHILDEVYAELGLTVRDMTYRNFIDCLGLWKTINMRWYVAFLASPTITEITEMPSNDFPRVFDDIEIGRAHV